MQYVRDAMFTALAAPSAHRRSWMQRLTVLWSSPTNISLSLLALVILALILPSTLDFLVFSAQWRGDAQACRSLGSGACWPLIAQRMNQFVYGFYPRPLQWRVNLAFMLLALDIVGAMLAVRHRRSLLALACLFASPVVAGLLIYGGVFGLVVVSSREWGGLLVTFVVACTGVLFSFPIGVLLALGRRSALPIVCWFCVGFIEIWRGVPLITVLFFSVRVLPLLLPMAVTKQIPDLLSVLVGVSLFTSAYVAEAIRGGLQVVPKGQFEASSALGLGYWKMHALVILPQAIRVTLPALVGIYIGLFKETTLVEIVGIFDLLGQVMLIVPDPAWTSPVTATTGFAFAALVYFCICFPISMFSRRAELRSDSRLA